MILCLKMIFELAKSRQFMNFAEMSVRKYFVDWKLRNLTKKTRSNILHTIIAVHNIFMYWHCHKIRKIIGFSQGQKTFFSIKSSYLLNNILICLFKKRFLYVLLMNFVAYHSSEEWYFKEDVSTYIMNHVIVLKKV